MKNENEAKNLEPEVMSTDSKAETNASALDEAQDALNELALEALENSSKKEEKEEPITNDEPTPMAPPVTEFQPTLEEPKKKNNLPLIILVLLVVAGLAFGIYYFLNNNKKDLSPKEQYAKILNDTYASASKYLTNDVEYDFTKPFALTLEGSVDSDIDEIKAFSGYKIKADMGLDMNAKKANLQLSMKDKSNKEILSAQAGADDKNLYIVSNKLFDKTIKMSNTTSEFWTSLEDPTKLLKVEMPENLPEGKDIDHFIKLIKDTIINNISDDSIKTSEEKITIDGKEENVTKLSYVLDKEETKKQFSAIAKAIKNDETSMKLLETLLEQSKAEVEQMLDEALENIEVETTVTFDLYVKNNELVELNFGVSKDDYLRYTVNSKKSTIVFVEEGKKQFEININEENKKQTIVTINVPEEMNATLTVREYNENKVDMDYSVTMVTENQTVSGTLNVTSDKNKLSGTFSINTKVEGKDLKANLSIEVTPNATVTLPNTANAVEYTALTQDDMTKIMTNLQNAIKGTPLEELMSTMGTGDIQM